MTAQTIGATAKALRRDRDAGLPAFPPVSGLPVPAAPRRRKRSRLRGTLALIICMFPSLFAIGYFGFVASDRYVSETSFIVRSTTRTTVEGLTALLRLIGVMNSEDDTFTVHDFITSRTAVAQLEGLIDLRAVYNREGADALSRYPNFRYGESTEDFIRYLGSRIRVHFNSNTGISVLSVQAFSAEEAHEVAEVILRLSEQMVNRINTRIHDDAVAFSDEEVKLAEDRLRQIQHEITEFRNREIQIDPRQSSVLVMELVTKMSEELSRLDAMIAEITATAQNSPTLASLQRRASVLREQIARERLRVTSLSDGLAEKIAKFDELNLEREFASRALASAITALDSARGEARRKQLYLERISGPSLPDKPMLPERWFNIASVIAANLVLLLIGWLIRTGVTEHAPKIEDLPE